LVWPQQPHQSTHHNLTYTASQISRPRARLQTTTSKANPNKQTQARQTPTSPRTTGYLSSKTLAITGTAEIDKNENSGQDPSSHNPVSQELEQQESLNHHNALAAIIPAQPFSDLLNPADQGNLI